MRVRLARGGTRSLRQHRVDPIISPCHGARGYCHPLQTNIYGSAWAILIRTGRRDSARARKRSDRVLVPRVIFVCNGLAISRAPWHGDMNLDPPVLPQISSPAREPNAHPRKLQYSPISCGSSAIASAANIPQAARMQSSRSKRFIPRRLGFRSAMVCSAVKSICGAGMAR